MRLASLTLGSDRPGPQQQFKNLKNVTIDFDEDEWITVVIGWNGTGKSNVLEAVATIFRDLIGKPNKKGEHSKPEPPAFAYLIRYFCHSKEIVIDADPDRKSGQYKIKYRPVSSPKKTEPEKQGDIFTEEQDASDDFISLTKKDFENSRDDYLPKYVFGYYSGHSQRMHEVFQPYLKSYDSRLFAGVDPGLRKMFYAKPVHSQFTLLAFMLRQDKFVQSFLADHLGIDAEIGFDSVLFVLNEPPWKSNAEDGDPRFWMSRGVVKGFLQRLYDVSLAPIRVKREKQVNLWSDTSLEHLFLYVKDIDALKDLVGEQEPAAFFRDLESTYVSQLIDEVRIRIRIKNNDGTVTFRELSEGEQQLLTVLGLLRFTAEDESLFLLDEPDTHLNPKWSVDYIDYLNKFITSGTRQESSSHIVLTTHNPIALAELKKEQVQILHRDNDSRIIQADKPHYDPQGMGYTGIITSDMFGLPSSLDKRTQRRLETYRALSAIKNRTDFQSLRLQVIQKWLDEDRFTLSQRDDDYQRYLEARSEILSRKAQSTDYKALIAHARSLSSDERERVAREAVEAILSGDD
ncbi:AAA family ATPase [Endozoicomonas ascidiicola]|uniref:AAA family ATPase n=1 Tax=Endozoicomonas ascidiicola TaxID=1698521 RepID=UPI00083313B8|nr:AAA family ATPase [Endozoicomonas ascidiicola]